MLVCRGDGVNFTSCSGWAGCANLGRQLSQTAQGQESGELAGRSDKQVSTIFLFGGMGLDSVLGLGKRCQVGVNLV